MTTMIIDLSTPFNTLYKGVREYPTHCESKLFTDLTKAKEFIIQNR